MPSRLLQLALILALSFAVTERANAEIQTLFRGQVFSPEEGAAKLATFGATYKTGDEWKARAASIRKGILRGLKLESLPAACPLNPIRRGAFKGDGYTVENVAFEALPGYFVTGNLYTPEKVEGKVPGILCPHGHGGDPRMAAYTQTRCAALARMGAIVFAIDMVGIGESAPVPHLYAESMRLQTYDNLRAIDFLTSLDAVDPDRLACTGESGGGSQTFILGAIDDRIDVTAPVVMVSSYHYGGCTCESGLPVHKNGADYETDNVEIAATFAPKPQLIVSDGGDWTAHTPETEFPYVQHVYDLCGAKGNVENAHFATERHDYGPSKRAAVYKFMAKQLKLDLAKVQNAAGEIDESFFKPRQHDELLVFTNENPRPDKGPKTPEAVFALLNKKAPDRK